MNLIVCDNIAIPIRMREESNMFVIGKAKGKVSNGKLELPKEYHLKRKDLLGKWSSKYTLYLSDSAPSLRFVTGDITPAIRIYVDSEDRIVLPDIYENSLVEIRGCVSTVEVTFINKSL
ncbi:MAG: hypothetical protein ACYDEX_15030 [Mobilitalea sp.]